MTYKNFERNCSRLRFLVVGLVLVDGKFQLIMVG